MMEQKSVSRYGVRAVLARSLVHVMLGCALMLCIPFGHADAQGGGSGARQAVAIVVNPHTAVTDISFAELRRIFLGQQQFWPDRSKITLLVRAPVAPERAVVLELLTGIKRAGADLIVTYHALDAARWLQG